MDYSITPSGDTRIAQIKGRLTFQEQRLFRTLIEDLFSAAATRYVIDLRQVDYIDSSGLGMLLIARKRAQQAKAVIALVNVPASARETFTTARFEDLFEISG